MNVFGIAQLDTPLPSLVSFSLATALELTIPDTNHLVLFHQGDSKFQYLTTSIAIAATWSL